MSSPADLTAKKALVDWTDRKDAAMDSITFQERVYYIEKNLDELASNELSYTTLTHADVQLLMAIYAFELYRYLCAGGQPPRDIIPDFFLNSKALSDSIKDSEFELYGSTRIPTTLYEQVVTYYKEKTNYCKKFEDAANFLKSGNKSFTKSFNGNEIAALNKFYNVRKAIDFGMGKKTTLASVVQ